MYTRESRQRLASKVKYAYFHVGDGEGTLAYVQDNDSLFFGASFCAPSDNFCRQTGREIARSRLFTKNPPAVTLNCDDPKKHAIVRALKEIKPQWIGCDERYFDQVVEYRISKSFRRRHAAA